ncbi:oxidoreductase [Longispora fulva]|uniref:FAD/FMN-containing dehydrogenase n=1 Tax=Longispora fulva TaxID=619741 RepID=A0A8J7KDH5_9ACTN|nr:FAD-binding oxidoreductase [Longispora fulva]MBG6134025.1 FAD/FMN-containing dehydrogenase [Longispora fulva]GIG63542.1 oxidoreductase [Longispora fulva]
MTDFDGRPRRDPAFASLRETFRGELLGAGETGYDHARRVWNGMHDRRPALIARCLDSGDVSAALRYARTVGLPVTVRGGGHNVAGTAVADAALMIDLSLMRAVTVDAAERVAVAEGGCLLSDLDAATVPHDLACPAGVVSHTGLAGLALGGGYGWLGRKWGLTCDHILAAEVVLADGSVVEAAADRHADLFWALRGGGGNFGIVTRFTLRLRPVGPVYFHTGVYSLADAPAALREYRTFAEKQPSDLHTIGAFKHAGQQSWIPVALRGTPALFLTAVWLGEPTEGPGNTGPLFDAAPPAGASARVMPYAELQALGDHSEPHGNRYFTKSCYLADLTDDPVAEMTASADEMRSPLSCIDFEYLRGAIADVPEADSAFPRRDAPYIYTVSAQWTESSADQENIDWSRHGVRRLAPWQYGGAYVNYLQDEPSDAVIDVYGQSRYSTLADVKRRYDPDNLLAGNQNIVPAPSSQRR